MKRLLAKAAVLAVLAAPLMASSCDLPAGVIKVTSITIEDVVTPRSIDGGGASDMSQVRIASSKATDSGSFKLPSRLAGTLVVRFQARAGYEDCVLDFNGLTRLPVVTVPNGDWEVRRLTPAFLSGRTISGSLTCEGTIWGSEPAATTFTVRTQPAGQLTAAPTSLDFTDTAPGQATASKRVIVTNMGDAAVQVVFLLVRGDQAFTITGGTCALRLINPQGDCQVDVAFTPPRHGAFAADLLIQGSGWFQPTVHLTGVSASSRDAVLAFSSESVDFGNVNLGETKSLVVTVRNDGRADLRIDGIAMQGNQQFMVWLTDCAGRSLSVGASCQVEVRFTPTSAGLARGDLEVRDSALGSPHTIAVTGTGIDPNPAPPPRPSNPDPPGPTPSPTRTAPMP